MKRCTKCGEDKPLGAFYKRKTGRGGVNSQCKACAAGYGQRWRKENPDRVAVYRERQNDSLRAGQKRWRDRNPEKVRAMRKARNERLKADPAARAKARARDYRWRRENPEKFRAQRLAQNHRRRESRVAMRSDADVRAYALVLMKDPCSYCGEPMKDADHIVPHAQGGLTVWENLTASCPTCNRRKGTQSLLHFLAA